MNKNLTEEEFDELIYDDEEQALIFFHKEGCNACHDVLTELERLEGLGGWTFAGADALKEKGLFSRFGLNGVPQVLLFSGGKLIRTLSGRKTQAEYKNALEFHGYLGGSVIAGEIKNGSGCSNDICYLADVI